MSTQQPPQPSEGSPFPTSAALPNAAPSPAEPPARVVDSMREGAHKTIDQLADGATAQVRHAQEKLTHATDSLQQSARQWRASGEEWAECLRVTVRQTPLTALATALAIGLLVARLTR